MKNLKNFSSLVIVAALLGMLVVPAAAFADEGKLPISTGSKQALDYYLQGRNLFEKLRVQESKQYFEKAVAEDPYFAVGYLQLAFAQPSNKGFFENLDKAKNLLKNASPGERLWILGIDAANNGDPTKQEELYGKLAEMYPNDERVQTLMGNFYFGQQDYEKAIKKFNAAIKINPDFSQPYNQLGYAYRFLGRFDDAEGAFQKYIELIPDDPNPYDSYAELLMKRGDFEKSIETYNKALQINPNFVASHIGIATNYNFLGQYDLARKELQDMYDGALDDGQRRAARFAMAVSYVDQGDYQSALAEIDKQYKLAEKINDPTAMAGDLAAKGNILLQTGKPDEALALYEKSLDKVMSSSLSEDVKENNKLGFLYNEARVALAKHDLIKAKANYQKYSEKANANQNLFQIRNAHELAGLIALQENDPATALAEFQNANQQNMLVLASMVKAYKTMGDKANARQTCEQLVNYNQLNSLNYALVRHHAEKLLATL